MSERGIMVGQALLLALLAAVVYLPALHGAFVWDDGQLLTNNPQIEDPSGWWRVWVAPTGADYFPFTLFSFWVEWRFWDFDPTGYHVTNVLLHAVASILTWRVLSRLSVPGAWFAAAIFAVHPLCVESVAWIAERKNTLSQVFFLLTILAYLRFERSVRRRDYVVAVVLFLFALLAKSSVVVLPVVLLLLAWWQRDAITRADLRRTAPFFVASLLLGVLTILFQYGVAIGDEVIPIGGPVQRVMSALFAVGFYLFTAVAPFNLMPVYPQWHLTLPWWVQLLPGVCVVGLLAFAWVKRDRQWARATLFGVGYFVVGLLPVVGLLKMSYMRVTLVADHFAYLSLPGIIALLVAGAWRWFPRSVFTGVCVVTIGVFSMLSWRHAGAYESSEALWRAALEKNPDTWLGQHNLAAALFARGEYGEALDHITRAVELQPANRENHVNLALTLDALGRFEQAAVEYDKALRMRDDPVVRLSLANALSRLKRYDEALAEYLRVVQLDDTSIGAHFNAGRIYEMRGEVEQAMRQFELVLRIDPTMRAAQQRLDALRSRKPQ